MPLKNKGQVLRQVGEIKKSHRSIVELHERAVEALRARERDGVPGSAAKAAEHEVAASYHRAAINTIDLEPSNASEHRIGTVREASRRAVVASENMVAGLPAALDRPEGVSVEDALGHFAAREAARAGGVGGPTPGATGATGALRNAGGRP